MKRRTFISLAAAGAALSSFPQNIHSSPVSNSTIKPFALKSGDTIGVIAPGTAVSDPDDIAKAKEAADLLCIKIKFGRYVTQGSGYKSRTVKERLEDLHSMFLDVSIKGIICIRGGYGCGQLIDQIDYSLIRANPKVFVGYSDITALHLAIQKKSNMVTFHGPMMVSSLTKYSQAYLQKAIFSPNPIGSFSNPTNEAGIRNSHPLRVINSGKSTGKLTGGNLSLISSLMGTPYEIDTEGKILFIEDVGEEPYRIDRMLNQLKLAGKLQKAAGIIVGECSDCEYKQAGSVWDESLGEIIDRYFANLKCPVIYGLMIGHTSDQITIPLGVEAELDADNKTITIKENGVV
jgi:muramoyltetrapeptide carboxypeptidase